MVLAADRRRELRLIAICVTFGNSTIEHCTRNARRILGTFNRLDIPIYSGAHCGLVNGKLGTTDLFHGSDGLGDTEFEQPPPPLPRQSEHAAAALTRLAREHKGELAILALAPLTTVALATRLDPEFSSNVGDIVIMGGNFTGLGNTTVAGEFNFFTDPEAAHVVIASARRPITIATWELCLQHSLDMSWRKAVLGAVDSAAARLFNAAEARVLEDDMFGSWITCDQAAAALLVRPQIARNTSAHHASVELQGQLTRGQLVVDRRDWHAARARTPCNVNIVQALDMQLYKKMLLDAFGHPDIEF
ncbi:probable uridine nucleosidase 2 isoform X2 [Amphibalanus amphitrite]|nr:probable uridine nucleosidase 2 isoform X2 [Amphibalanus amphitrite]